MISSVQAPRKKRVKISFGWGMAGRLINGLLLLLIGFLMLYPFWYVLVYSLSTYNEVIGQGVIFIPHGFTFSSWKSVIQSPLFLQSYGNTLFVVIVGTTLSLVTTALFAYPLARKVRGTRFFNMFIYFTMLFGGGMIPTFYVVRQTGLLDSLWSLILPALISPFNVFVMRSFFEGIPAEMVESANIDGATELRTFVQIILPLSLPVVATITLFYAVGYWNKFFDAVLYINSIEKRPLQLLLKEMISSSSNEMFAGIVAGMTGETSQSDVTPMTLKMATITLSVLPVMVIYPFLQKYFVKGVMIGAVKG